MKITDMDYIYCLATYGKEQCSKCKRNIKLYEDEHIALYWVASYKIRNSKAKVCPEYEAMDRKEEK